MMKIPILRAIAGAVAKLRARIATAGRSSAAAFGRALPDLLILAGAAGIGVGLWWIYRPAAPLMLGVMALVAGLLMARGEKP